MQIHTYLEATDWLFKQFPSYQAIGAAAYKPSLDNIHLLCVAFGQPQDELRFIHIAGTNGKGSTSSMLASILTESGEKVGLFTSPHITDFRERIRVNGEVISEVAVIDFCNAVQAANLAFEPSFFEITFVLALLHFKQEECSVCVIETGLGGRLDATNIIVPELSIITNISIEHTQFLGNTLAKIAGEKAGIIKRNVPVIIGEFHAETHPVFLRVAEEQHAEITVVEEMHHAFRLPLLGDYQQRNLATVLTALRVWKKDVLLSPETIQRGLDKLKNNTGFFGRMEIIAEHPLVLLDVSHNLDGVVKTLKAVEQMNKGILHLIYGTSADKDYAEIIAQFPANAWVYFCTFSNQRSLKREDFSRISLVNGKKPFIFDEVKVAIKEVQAVANKEDTILVFGSFFLVSDFF